MSHRCQSLPSTGSGVFSDFQLTLMTARFDGLESIIRWDVVCGGKIESELLHDSIELSITGTRSHTSSFLAHIMRTSRPKPSTELNQAAWTAHTSFATNTAAANVYKGNGPTKILMKMILIKGWDVTEGRVQYHVTQFKIPGGVLNILDLTSIITSKGAMVLCARVALMCAVCL
ncbi:hypothetical protein B0H14DRAFT_3466101 [Mycena olivaceomarginata]|nr:hypothetical protein B0H14DRAFT_3466101 [Mycena olivaceomarginata]